MNINDITSQPASFTNASTQYAYVDEQGEILQVYSTKEAALYMRELNKSNKVFEVITLNNKILSVGEECE